MESGTPSGLWCCGSLTRAPPRYVLSVSSCKGAQPQSPKGSQISARGEAPGARRQRMGSPVRALELLHSNPRQTTRLLKGHACVMRLLVGDVLIDGLELGRTHRVRGVAGLPIEAPVARRATQSTAGFQRSVAIARKCSTVLRWCGALTGLGSCRRPSPGAAPRAEICEPFGLWGFAALAVPYSKHVHAPG